MPQTKLPLMGYSSKPTKQKSEIATLKQEWSQYKQMLLSAQAAEILVKMCLGVKAINILLYYDVMEKCTLELNPSNMFVWR